MERLVEVGATWRSYAILSDDYIEASVGLAKALPLPLQKDIASTFAALEIEVGHWHAFYHFHLLTLEQYAAVTDLSPSEILDRARYADALCRWWTEIGYPFIKPSRDSFRLRTDHFPEGFRLQRERHAMLAGRANPDERTWFHSASRFAWSRELDTLDAWASERYPDDPVLHERLAACRTRIRPPRVGSHPTRCVVDGIRHPGQSCILCGVPASFSLVADRYQGSCPLAPVGVRRGERQKDRARSAQVHRQS